MNDKTETRRNLDQARWNLPLPMLMTQCGHTVPSDAKGSIICPYCGNKSGSLKQFHGRWYFKCFQKDCGSATCGPNQSWDEVRFLASHLKLSETEAIKIYLEMAGVAARSVSTRRERSRSKPAPVDSFASQSEDGGGIDDADPTGAEESPASFENDDVERFGVATDTQKALRAAYEKFTLTEAHADALFAKRGLPRQATEAYGFKSSQESNRPILESMGETYPPNVLVNGGLWKTSNGQYKPETQLCGWGQTGKKDANGDHEWGQVNPLVIPRFGNDGSLLSLRPHKGGISHQPPHLFIARFRKGYTVPVEKKVRPHRCVICEGEFKACALHWAFAGGIGAAAMPGISMAKNVVVMSQLRQWLREESPEEIIVAFDSEEKSDPTLPGFKADPRKRHEALVWAIYLAKILKEEFSRVLVCHLPTSWRDDFGKADLDGAMARMVNARTKESRPEAR